MPSESWQQRVEDKLDNVLTKVNRIDVVEARLGEHKESLDQLWEKHDDHESRIRAQEIGSAGSKWVTGGAKLIVSAVVGALCTAVLGLVVATKLQPATEQFKAPTAQK